MKSNREPWVSERLVCRPALPSDTPAVLELCSHIWGGNDYLPNVWLDWLADPVHHHLIVALWGAEITGIVDRMQLGPAEWYLAALRVHPKYQGRGFSSHIFQYALDACLVEGGVELRLITAQSRKVVHHLCEKFNFRHTTDYYQYQAEPLPGEAAQFQPLLPFEIETALAQLRQNPLFPPELNLIDLGWEYCRPNLEWLSLAVTETRAFSWQRGRGNLTFFFDEYDGLKFPYIESITCDPADLTVLLRDARRWAGMNGFSTIYWNTLPDPHLADCLASAGFKLSEGHDPLYLFERTLTELPRPGNPG